MRKLRMPCAFRARFVVVLIDTMRVFVALAQIVAVGWGIVSVRKTEAAHAAELKRLRETKTLAELMSLNMGA